MLWSGTSAYKNIVNAHDRLHCQMLALSFLLLLDSENGAPSMSKFSTYAEEAVTVFESSCGAITKDDAAFLLKEIHAVFNRCLAGGRGDVADGVKQPAEMTGLFFISEIVLVVIKVLCQASFQTMAGSLINEFETKFRDFADCQCTATLLGKWAVKIYSSMKTGGESRKALTECARILRALPSDLGDKEAHSVLEGCRLVLWAIESGRGKELSGPVLLAWFSFLEEHQECILKTMKKASVLTEQMKMMHVIVGYHER